MFYIYNFTYYLNFKHIHITSSRIVSPLFGIPGTVIHTSWPSSLVSFLCHLEFYGVIIHILMFFTELGDPQQQQGGYFISVLLIVGYSQGENS